MKTLIILKGLVKRDKLDWVKKQGLELFFLDYNSIRSIYSAPELLTPNKTILNFSYSDTVYRRFLEILCLRMSKGCLIVLDIENLTCSVIETLADIFGYKIFWVINDIPSDYLKNTSRYVDPMLPQKSKLEYKKDILNYNNSVVKIDPDNRVTSFQQIERYWNNIAKQNNLIELGKEDFNQILHISDLHSHYDLFKGGVEGRMGCSDFNIIYGDYIDGPVDGGSRAMLDYVLKDRKDNNFWLEGNHELRLRKYLGYRYFESIGKPYIAELLTTGLVPDFLTKTTREFSDISPEEGLDYIKDLNKKLKLFFIISISGTEYICTHSGFRYLDQLTPKFIGNVVYGSRNIERVDRTFSEKVGREMDKWSIHAHCKYPEWQVSKYPYVMNIDPLDENEVVLMTQTKNQWKVCKLLSDNLS